jgi:hypothetical protein
MFPSLRQHESPKLYLIFKKKNLERYFEEPCDSKLVDRFYMKNGTNYVELPLGKSDLTQNIVGIHYG